MSGSDKWWMEWIEPKKWKNFTKTITDPSVLFLLLFTIIFIALSIFQTNKFIIAFFSVFISLLSGLVGAILYKRWSDFTESGKLAVRGKSAIRNLKMLLNNITQLREKVITFICPRLKEEHTKETSEIIMREIIDRCTNLQEETVNSIENWTDIIPEAEIKTEIGEISKLQMELIEREKELAELKGKEVVSAEVKQKIEFERDAWLNLLDRITERQNKIDITVPSTGVGYSGFDMSKGIVKQCKLCGNKYYDSSFSLLGGDICPMCRTKPSQ